jgi:hypothetical protein
MDISPPEFLTPSPTKSILEFPLLFDFRDKIKFILFFLKQAKGSFEELIELHENENLNQGLENFSLIECMDLNKIDIDNLLKSIDKVQNSLSTCSERMDFIFENLRTISYQEQEQMERKAKRLREFTDTDNNKPKAKKPLFF